MQIIPKIFYYFFITSVAYGAVHISSLEELIPDLTPKSCLFFDLDETLIYPKNSQIFRKGLDKALDEYKERNKFNVLVYLGALQRKRQYCSEIMNKTQFDLIERENLLKIYQLSLKNSFHIFGLTARGGSCMVQSTQNSFAQIQLTDDSHAKPIYLNEIFTQGKVDKKKLHNFHQGITYTHRGPKGEYLSHFLTQYPNLCDRVLFVDDNPKYVSSVEGIQKSFPQVTSYHYMGYEKTVPKYIKEFQKIQFEHFFSKGKFLSDEETFSLINN